MVRHPDAHVQELPLAGSVVIRDGGFGHVAGAVHLMLGHVIPAVLQARERVERVDVAVRLLCGGELVDPLVAFGFQFRIRMDLQGIGHSLQGLVHVGIVVIDARMLAQSLGGILEIADTARLVLDLVDAHRQGGRPVPFQPRGPEIVCDLHLGEGHRGDPFHRLVLL